MEDDARDPFGLSELGVAGRCSTGIDASTPAAWLEMLARDESEEVRLWTACNPALPEQLRCELMERAGVDAVRAMQERIARSEGELGRTLLAALLRSPFASVMEILLERDDVPDELIEEAAYDDDPAVSAAACKALGWE